MRTIFNTSFIIDENIEPGWVEFMREHYLPVIKDNELCQDIIFTKVSIDQPDGKTYSLQLVFSTERQMEYFLENWAAGLEEKMSCQYANGYVCFSSVLTEI